jgi:type VI protein secretion system component Hcp
VRGRGGRSLIGGAILVALGFALGSTFGGVSRESAPADVHPDLSTAALIALTQSNGYVWHMTVDPVCGTGEHGSPANSIALASVSFSATAGGGTGRPVFDDISITKFADTSSTKLHTCMVQGRRIARVVLAVRKPAANPNANLYEVTLTDATLMSFDVSGSDAVREHWSFDYREILITYRRLFNSGTVGAPLYACYDVVNNVGSNTNTC